MKYLHEFEYSLYELTHFEYHDLNNSHCSWNLEKLTGLQDQLLLPNEESPKNDLNLNF